MTDTTKRALTAGGDELWRLLDAMRASTHGGASQSTVTAWTETLERAMTLRGRAIEDAVIATTPDPEDRLPGERRAGVPCATNREDPS